jgi:hypothetical protein
MMEEQGGMFGGLSGLDRIESGIPLEYELPTDARGGSGGGGGGGGGASGIANSRFGTSTPMTVEEEGGTGAATPEVAGWDSAATFGSRGGGGGGSRGGAITGRALAAAVARWMPQSAPPEWAVALAARLAVPWGPSRQAAPWTVLPGVALETATGGRRGATLAHAGLGADTGLNRAFLWLAWNQGSAVMDAFFKPARAPGSVHGGGGGANAGGRAAGASVDSGSDSGDGSDEEGEGAHGAGAGDEEEGRAARGGRSSAGAGGGRGELTGLRGRACGVVLRRASQQGPNGHWTTAPPSCCPGIDPRSTT